MLTKLTVQEIGEIAASVLSPHRDGVRVSPRALQDFVRGHLVDESKEPAEMISSLILKSLELRPISSPLTDEDPLGVRESCRLAVECGSRLLAKNDRFLPEDFLAGEYLSWLVEIANGVKGPLNSSAILRTLRPFMPFYSWAECLPDDEPARGLRAGIVCPFTGLNKAEVGLNRSLVDAVYSVLKVLGFSVVRSTEHEHGVDCGDSCAAERNFDLCVVINTHPTTRGGHQLKEVSDHLGVTLVLTPPSVSDLTCLFKQSGYGVFILSPFDGTPGGAASAVRGVVEKNLSLLAARDEVDRALSARLRPEYFSLRTRVLEALDSGVRASRGLISRASARRLISSIDAYGGASQKSIEALRMFTEGDGVLNSPKDPLETLFNSRQLVELDLLIEQGGIESDDRPVLMYEAARDLVGGSGDERRTRTYRGPDDWLGLARQLLPSQYGESS